MISPTNKLVDLYWLGKYFEHMQEHRKSSRDDKYKHQRSFLLEIPPEFLQVYSAGTVICLRDVFRGFNVVLPILYDLNGYINKNNLLTGCSQDERAFLKALSLLELYYCDTQHVFDSVVRII